MTLAERAEIERVVAPTSQPALLWVPDADPRFTRLQAGPCPLLNADKSCGVYDVRPLNCRTFMCGRPDVSREPYEAEPAIIGLGLTGCGNLSARLNESLRFRAHYRTHATIQMRTWGKAHGY